MPTTQTQLFDPPSRSAIVDPKGFIAIPFRQWLFSVQYRVPLRVADTSGGSYTEALPAAGTSSANTTGQSNQNQEIIYVKGTSDANTFTITGAISGSVTLTSQYQAARFKSDGTNWWAVGTVAGGGGGAAYPSGSNACTMPRLNHASAGLQGFTVMLRIPASYIQAFTATGFRVGIWTTSVLGLVVNSASIAKTLPNQIAWSTAPIAFTWPAGSFLVANTLYLSNICPIAGDTSHDYYIAVYFDLTSSGGNAYATENTLSATADTAAAFLYNGFAGWIMGNHTNDADATNFQIPGGGGKIFCIQQVLAA